MSRVSKSPVAIPSGTEVNLSGQHIAVKGSKGALEYDIHAHVDVAQEDGHLRFSPREGMQNSEALAGTMRALVMNMLKGVSEGYEIKLRLVGVGYRAQLQGQALDLVLGFSHPVKFPLPEGVTAEVPAPTDIVLKSVDKQKVGQVAANIRRLRPPEPYKGKGIRYADEQIVMKEAKKK